MAGGMNTSMNNNMLKMHKMNNVNTSHQLSIGEKRCIHFRRRWNFRPQKGECLKL